MRTRSEKKPAVVTQVSGFFTKAPCPALPYSTSEPRLKHHSMQFVTEEQQIIKSYETMRSPSQRTRCYSLVMFASFCQKIETNGDHSLGVCNRIRPAPLFFDTWLKSCEFGLSGAWKHWIDLQNKDRDAQETHTELDQSLHQVWCLDSWCALKVLEMENDL